MRAKLILLLMLALCAGYKKKDVEVELIDAPIDANNVLTEPNIQNCYGLDVEFSDFNAVKSYFSEFSMSVLTEPNKIEDFSECFYVNFDLSVIEPTRGDITFTFADMNTAKGYYTKYIIQIGNVEKTFTPVELFTLLGFDMNEPNKCMMNTLGKGIKNEDKNANHICKPQR